MANIVVANAKIIVTGKRSTESQISSTDQEIHFDNTCALHFYCAANPVFYVTTSNNVHRYQIKNQGLSTNLYLRLTHRRKLSLL
jgi:hypothetical protein